MVFVKSHIPLTRLTEFKLRSSIQIIAFEINLRKKKWLVASIYKVPSRDNKYFLLHLTFPFSFAFFIRLLRNLPRKGLNSWWFLPRSGK